MLAEPTGQLLIVQPGEKLPSLSGVPGDFADWVRLGAGLAENRVRVVKPHLGEALPPADAFDAVVITGSAAMVTDNADWISTTSRWLVDTVEADKAVLGICFGHQLLAQALGGEVTYNPRGTEVGSVTVTLEGTAAQDPLFEIFPRQMDLFVSHRQIVKRLPEDATSLARSAMDDHQAFVLGRRAWGVQFHPEFSAEITRAHVAYYADTLAAEGTDPEEAARNVRESVFGDRLLRRFCKLAKLE
ncbi:MAG: glutamine amidotransferase [Pseudomonadota bacterium]